MLEALFGFGFGHDLVRIGRIAHDVGGLAHLPHRLFERVLQFRLEAVPHLLQLGVGLRELLDRARQLLGPEDDERQDQDHDDFAALEVEHAGSLRAWHHLSECSSASPHVSIHRSHSPTVAHAAHAPENTIEAFELALRLGATGLESDVWLTADGVAVLDHDGVAKIRRRKRPIRELLRSQLPGHIPSLAEMLAACGTGYALSLDLKDPAAGPEILRTVREHDPAMVEHTWLCDIDLPRLRALRVADPDARLLLSTRLDRIKEGPERRAATLARDRIDGINLNRRDWNGGLVVLAHRFELVAFGWDMQLEHELRDGLRMGLDAVYSDHVDVMVDAMKAEIGSL